MDEPIVIPEWFRGLHPDRAVTIYIRNLPHWRQESASYFVTIRLHDSVPEAVLKEHRIELRNLYREVGIEPDSHFQSKRGEHEQLHVLHQEQARALENVLDSGHGSCLLKDEKARTPVIKAFRYHAEHSFHLHSYVIMPNHCHALVSPFPKKSLEKILQSIKSYSSRRIAGSGQVWQQESHDTIVRDEEHFRNAARYIRKNPTKARLLRSDFTLHENK